MKVSTRASRGCIPCRQRKIKCDQSKPHCQMCVKRSKRCFGYREEADLMFRNETETVVRKVGKISNVDQARGSSNLLTHTTSTNHRPDEVLLPAGTWTPTENSASLSSRPLDSPGLPSISRSQLDIPDSEQSLSLFFHQYVGLSDGVTPGMNEFLPQFYQQAQPNSCLKHCVAATAYASLANQSKSTAIGRKAWESYGKALSSVNATLADPVESLKDETLAGLFVLGMFENISAQQLHIFGVHGSGMDRLLHFRGPQRRTSYNGQRISKAVCDYLQIRNLSLGRRPPPHEHVFFGDPKFSVQYRIAMLSISNISRVRADAEDLLTEAGNTSLDDNDASLQRKCDALTAIVAEMKAIHNDHWSWFQDAPDSWHYVSISSPAAPDGTIHIYYNLWMSNFWNFTRSSCILLQTSILKCLNMLSSISETLPSHDSLREDAQTTIKTMIREICATIPFVMSDIDSQGNTIKVSQTAAPPIGQSMAQLWFLWHCRVMLLSGYILPHQVKFMRDAMLRIGHEKGIRVALLGGRAVN